MRSSLYGVDLVDDMPVVHVPPLTPAMYVNLTAIFGHGRIVEGSHDNAQAVRTVRFPLWFLLLLLLLLVPKEKRRKGG